MTNFRKTLTLLAIILLSSCATYGPKYSYDHDASSQTTDISQISNSFFILGGTAEPKAESEDTLELLKALSTENNSKADFILFLGNSFPSQSLDGSEVKAQLAALEDFKGKVVVVPGNLDWQEGVKGLEIQEDFLKDKVKGKDILQPNNGCPIESIDINDSVHLLVIDSQWFLEDWNDHPDMNTKCEIKTRAKFFIEIEGELKKNKDKTIVFAMHHPMITNGKYGGQFGFAKQFFPLPGIGILNQQIQSRGAISKQDRYNERYNDLMNRLNVMAKDHDRFVFVSGHENSLQYSEDYNSRQIVSGAGSSATRVALGQYGEFGYGGKGLARLDVFTDGAAAVSFYASDSDDKGSPLFRKKIIEVDNSYDIDALKNEFPATVKASVYKDELVEKTGLFKTVWGDHYRKIYGTEVTAKVALLDTLYGGLEVVRAGGGHQTRSLRLKDKKGKDYNMRALKKSAVQFLQTVILKDKEVEEGFKNTITEDLILDFYTAAHPYGAFTIPKLSEAAGVFHTNPKLYYVPKQKALGKYNRDYGDELYMIVERPDEPYDGAIFNYADDIESTDDLLDKIRSDEENVVDEKAYIRARLFDMLIGDWDRHSDQWRWAEFKNIDNKDVFVPIPRDRDQVYANFDGGLLDVVRSIFSTSRQFQVYGEELEHTKWFNLAGIKLDRALIENHGREEWIAQATKLRESVTDEVIEAAFKDLPQEAQDETALAIKQKLKGRRGNMVKIANEYYEYLSRLQTVTGTDKDDFFDITRMPNGETSIKVYRIKGGEKADLMVDRVYSASETKEVWVYGLGDDDVFEVKGEGSNLIKIRIIGGQNNDVYNIQNGRKIKVYDHRTKKNTVQSKGGASFRFTDNYNFNTYNYLKQKLTSNLILPAIGFNPDDGFKIGFSDVFTVHGFQQNPFAQQHRFSVGYYTETEGIDVNYEGEFANIFGSWNFLIGGSYRTDLYAENFFGFGNETINPRDEFPEMFEIEYNQVRRGGYEMHLGVTKDGNYGSTFTFTAGFEAVEVEGTPGRFITENPPLELDNVMNFVSLDSRYDYESYDNKANPTRGLDFALEAGSTMNIDNTDSTFAYLDPELILYNALTKDRKVVLKTAARGQVRIGDGFEFYQAAQLGGDSGLRGFRDERFTGKYAASGSADLRYSFNQFRTGLAPIQIGIFGGYDLGRVWLPGEDSDKLHNDYGGGFWVNAADVLSGTFNFFTSDEGLRFTFGVAVSM